MRFCPKTQKYEFSNLPQNNRSKRRSTGVDHVSEVRFEIESLDLRRFEKALKLSSSLLSFLLSSSFLFLFSAFHREGSCALLLSSFYFFLKVRRQCASPSLLFYIYIYILGGPSGPPFLHVGRTPAPHLFQMKGRMLLIIIFFSISLFSILYFLCIFNNIKLTPINCLPRFCILITTKYLKRYPDAQALIWKLRAAKV